MSSSSRDSIDESMEEELFSTELRLRDREKYLLGKINSALERLAAGTIDECEDCGECYIVEPDAFNDGAMTYFVGFHMEKDGVE